MKKKTLSLLLIAAMTAALLTGCGKENSGTPAGPGTIPVPSADEDLFQTKDSTAGENDDYDEDYDYDEDDDEEVIRPNGQIDELTDAETLYYTGVIFRATQALDTDTLSLYADDEDDLAYLEIIKADASKKEFWDKTIGQYIYFDAEGLVLSKSLHYIQANWYNDCWQNAAEIPFDDADEMSLEQAQAIYDKYYESAPYAITNYRHAPYMRTEDGYIKCDVDAILDPIIYSVYLDDLIRYDDSLNAGLLVFGDSVCYNLGYDYIEKSAPRYQEFLSGDLERITKTVWEMNSQDTQPEDYLTSRIDCFESEQYHDVAQTYLQENVEIFRDLSIVYYFMPMVLDEDDYSSETYEQLKDYNIVIYSHYNGDNGWGFIDGYYRQLEELGLLD